MTDIKFCGLKTGRDVAAAEQAGARWTGYVIFERSPRHVGPALAGELAHLARNSETVAVTVNPDDDLLARIRDAMHPDWIQLHGSEPPQRVLASPGLVNADFHLHSGLSFDASLQPKPLFNGRCKETFQNVARCLLNFAPLHQQITRDPSDLGFPW